MGRQAWEVAMLGVVSAEGQGEGDRLLSAAAERLRAAGLRLAGAVQYNVDLPGRRLCEMDLHALDGAGVVRISQHLGPGARGCRIDAGALEAAAALAERALAAGADLLIVNKFGKQEAEGRGFRPVIGAALAAGVPVLTAVKGGNRPAFDAFADGMAEAVPPDLEAILAWVHAAVAARAGA
jgi:nucleoside-triphosphatase THEP1